jgi:hypothetical protein
MPLQGNAVKQPESRIASVGDGFTGAEPIQNRKPDYNLLLHE